MASECGCRGNRPCLTSVWTSATDVATHPSQCIDLDRDDELKELNKDGCVKSSICDLVYVMIIRAYDERMCVLLEDARPT
jgi:hypothetical protein